MSDRDAFLRTILAAPDDDAPRLVYADWLDDQGEGERAEFIRVQCLLSRLIAEDKNPRRPAGGMELFGYRMALCRDFKFWAAFLERAEEHGQKCELCAAGRAREILAAAPFEEWAGDLIGEGVGVRVTNSSTGSVHHGVWLAAGGVPLIDFNFVRGLVGEVECDAADWLAHADAILAEHPVREVRLTTWPEVEHSTECVPELKMRRYRIARESRWGSKVSGQDDFVLERDVNQAGGSDDAVRGMVERLVRLQESRSAPEKLLTTWWPGVTFHLPQQPAVILTQPENLAAARALLDSVRSAGDEP